MKKRTKWMISALAVCAALLVWSAAEIRAAGNNLQYIIPAPPIETADPGQDGAQTGQADDKQTEVTPNGKTLALWKKLQTVSENWEGIFQSYTLSGIAEDISLAGDTEVTVQARLNALGSDAFDIEPEYLRVGRLFYPQELQNGARGILLDEQLALALFRVAEPIGRTVTISNMEFTVIGILRHAKKVGDSKDYSACITLAALWDQAIQLDALQVTALPVSGAGARAILKTDLENWQAGGTLIDLRKEGTGALMPLRVLLFFCGCAVLFRLLGIWTRRMRLFISDCRQRLRLEYLQKLLPRMLAKSFLFTLGGGVLLLGAAGLISYIVAPVYTFPEWVPAVLVEWEDIRSTFWQVRQGAASLMELRSPELIRIRYFAMVTGWCSAAAAVLLTCLWVRRQSGDKK